MPDPLLEEFLDTGAALLPDLLDEPLLAAAPMTVVDREADDGRARLAGAAAPTADERPPERGRVTSAPLAAAPITNFSLRLGGSGRSFAA